MIESMVFLVSCNILWFLFICTYSFNKYLLSKARSTAINKITSLSFWSSSHWESQTTDSCIKCVWIYLRRALKENEAVHNIGKSLVREHLIDRIFEQRRERVMPVSGGEYLALVMRVSKEAERKKSKWSRATLALAAQARLCRCLFWRLYIVLFSYLKF